MMLLAKFAIAVTISTVLLVSLLLPADDSAPKNSNDIVALLQQRLGKPDGRKDWHGTALDYKLADGRTFTVSVADGGTIWGGLKTALAASVSKTVTLSGTYLGPGKEANFIYTRDCQTVYLDLVDRGGTFPKDLEIGDPIVVVGTLRFRDTKPANRTDVTSVPSLFHIDDAQVTIDEFYESKARTKR